VIRLLLGGLAARPLRALLAVGALALGVGALAAALGLADTLARRSTAEAAVGTPLVVLAALALLAGAGAAAGALSLAAAERTGQRAMLRCAGVPPWRLAAWGLLEGAALGAVASVVGLLAGLALEHVLVAALVAPAGEPVVGPRTLLLAPAAGLVAATLAAAAPAWRATRG
jgi:putative ABC transport system permease protein